MLKKMTSLLLLFCLAFPIYGEEGGGGGDAGGGSFDDDGLDLPIDLGPRLTTFSFPTILGFGVEGTYQNHFGFALEFGLFPRISSNEVSFSLRSWNAAFHYYPWRGHFFTGMKIGTESFSGSYTQSISGLPTTYNLMADVGFIVPFVGWRWVAVTGFFYGVEAGLQIPFSTSTAFSSNASALIQSTTEYQNMVSEVESKANLLGKNVVPMFALVQVGWLF